MTGTDDATAGLIPSVSRRVARTWPGSSSPARLTLVTPVNSGVARPLVQGLSAEMIVRAPPPPGINDEPDEAVREALAEDAG